MANSPDTRAAGKHGRLRHVAITGAALAAAALVNRWAARRAERAHPPAGRFVEVGGVRLHYTEQGQGTPVVLIHGSGALVEDFTVSGLVELLSSDHRVLVFDRPGYGYSDRPRGVDWTPERQAKLLVDACSALGIGQPVVVGHSWGTLVALAWALDHRERLSGLVLLSGYYFPTIRLDALPTALAGSPVVGDVIVNTVAPLQARVTGPLGNRMIFSPARPTPEFLEQMPFELMLRPRQLHATSVDSARMPGAAKRLSLRYDELAEVPVTILWGDGDRLVWQKDQSARLAAMLPGANAIPVAGAGHMIHHLAPETVAKAIRELSGRRD